MSDPLEQFINNNRSEFDIDEPNPAIWTGIESNLKRDGQKKIYQIMGIAASALILVVAGYFFGSQQASGSVEKGMFATELDYNEFMEASDYYTTTINHKITEVQELGVGDDVFEDLKQLDEVYNELKEEMLSSASMDNEIIVNHMITNYKTKIAILESIIEKTKNAQQSKINSDETINI